MRTWTPGTPKQTNEQNKQKCVIVDTGTFLEGVSSVNSGTMRSYVSSSSSLRERKLVAQTFHDVKCNYKWTKSSM